MYTYFLTSVLLNYTLAWNLINDKDKKETEALMAKHLNENRDIIARNRRKQEEEAKKANYFSEKVKIDKRMKFESYKKELDEEKKRKEREEAELIEELVHFKAFDYICIIHMKI